MQKHPACRQEPTSEGSLLVERDTPDAANGDRQESAIGSKPNAGASTVKCSGCERPIAFQPPIPGEPVGMWLCKTCGAVYYGDDAAIAAANAFGVLRAAQAKSLPFQGGVSTVIDARITSIPPEYVQRLVGALAGDAHRGPERRKDTRYRMAVPVVAVPLGLDFCPAGEPLRMTTLDVSLGGASLVHTRFTETPYFALDFTVAEAEHVQVMLEVLKVRHLGPVYVVAGQFITRLSQRPAVS